MHTIQDMLDCPHANPKIAEAEHDYVRALQRYEASQRACREMFGSLSILVVPRADHVTKATMHTIHLGDLLIEALRRNDRDSIRTIASALVIS